MNRRTLLSATALTLPMAMLSACGLIGTPAGATNLQMAQVYADDLADAVSAAAQIYLAGPPAPDAAQAALVSGLIADLQTARRALDAATAASDARGIAKQLLTAALNLSPMITALLGPAAGYIPLAIGVVQAFIDSLPPPPAAPVTPPAALHRAALKYHGHH